MTQSPNVSLPTPTGLAALEQRLRQDLDYLCYPPKNWMPQTRHPAVAKVHDVVVIGGGMCGLTASFALLRAGIGNIRIFDQNPAGQEGPWVTYARMETLRSPKQLTGPASGLGALTFRAWYTAQFGEAAWEALDKIPRPMWMDYLRWYRQVLALPVENQVNVTRISPHDNLLRLDLAGAPESFVLTRKVVLATGREGIGHPTIPQFVETIPQDFWAHSSDDIDFKALKDKRVVVIGIGASAVDNAAEALEAGAAEVRLLIRRKNMPCINKMMGIGSYGFNAAFPKLGDDWRWRLMHYSFTTQTPAPHLSTLRVSRHDNAYFHFDAGIKQLQMQDQQVLIETVRGAKLATDFVILGTGFTIDPRARPEMAEYAEQILRWCDHYTPPADLAHDDIGRFPYLAADFSFQECTPGQAPWLKHIHSFNYGATISLGKISGDIPAVSEGAELLAQAVSADFYQRDIEHHWQTLLDYDTPELLGDEWTASDIPPYETSA